MKLPNQNVRISPFRLLLFTCTMVLAGLDMNAQQCNVSGGTLTTFDPTMDICLNDGDDHIIHLTVSGNVGQGRFGLINAITGSIVATNATGIFDMNQYSRGVYKAVHASFENVSDYSWIWNINQLTGCYSVSNFIDISTYWVGGGTITAVGSTELSSGSAAFAAQGGSIGPNLSWVLLNAQGTQILEVQPFEEGLNGVFSFDNYDVGIYRVVLVAYGLDIDLADVNPPHVEGCIDASNVVTVTKFLPLDVLEGEVYNPLTGTIWMDRNLGASQVATSATDQAAYGDLYQWGRGADGHQLRTSPTTTVQSSTDTPATGSFIIGASDWRNPKSTNLWQGVDGINNPCPAGFRVPTTVEWRNERLSWSSNDAAGAYGSPLKLTAAGYRNSSPVQSGGQLEAVNFAGRYWSSSPLGQNSRRLFFNSINANQSSTDIRSRGLSVRCIKQSE